MKAFIFDPLWDDLVTGDLLAKIKNSGLEIIVKYKNYQRSELR